jgi:hypothetical protein
MSLGIVSIRLRFGRSGEREINIFIIRCASPCHYYLHIFHHHSVFISPVSLRRHADGISFGEAMEEAVSLGALSLEDTALDQSEVLANDAERYREIQERGKCFAIR